MDLVSSLQFLTPGMRDTSAAQRLSRDFSYLLHPLVHSASRSEGAAHEVSGLGRAARSGVGERCASRCHNLSGETYVESGSRARGPGCGLQNTSFARLVA